MFYCDGFAEKFEHYFINFSANYFFILIWYKTYQWNGIYVKSYFKLKVIRRI